MNGLGLYTAKFVTRAVTLAILCLSFVVVGIV